VHAVGDRTVEVATPRASGRKIANIVKLYRRDWKAPGEEAFVIKSTPARAEARAMLRRAPSSLASAISAFANGRHRVARELLGAHQDGRVAAHAPVRAPVGAHAPELLLVNRLGHNLAGVLAHHAGDHEAAARDLSSALRVAETQSRSGLGHDAYVDLAGVLIDTAVNELARGHAEPARHALKRARYMSERAYRPDARLLAMCDAVAAELALSSGDRLGALRCSIDAVARAHHELGTPQPGGPGGGAVRAGVRASVACVRVRCLRTNGLHAEAVEAATAALAEYDATYGGGAPIADVGAGAGAEAEAEAPSAHPLPLVHARLLTAHALALRAAGSAAGSQHAGVDIDIVLALRHAQLLLEGELGAGHAHARIGEANAEASKRGPRAGLALRDLPLLPPGLGLADTDPSDLAWRPVGLGAGA